jgi:glycosyltransferase involved in cell wall biosynthesis
MHIVHMTSVHAWNDNRIFNKMCRSLAQNSKRVDLVAVMDENHDGKTVDGVVLHAVNKPHSRRERFMQTTPEVLKKAQSVESDLYHFHDPEFLPYIEKFRSLVRKPVIYDIHENYPAAILSKTWIPEISRFLVGKGFDLLERRKAAAVDGLIFAWPGIMERFESHSRKLLVNNYPYRDELNKNQDVIEKRVAGWFVYVGVLSPARGILEMIKAVGMGGNKYKLLLGGNWSSEEYRQKCQEERGWAFCDYKGYLDRKTMRELYANAQAGVIAFFPEPNHLYSIPNKIFEYMSAGLPVIASDLPTQRSIVEETGCGVVANAQSSVAIYDKMRWICEHPDEAAAMGKSGKQAVEDKFNWESEVLKLIAFYEEILTVNFFSEASVKNVT